MISITSSHIIGMVFTLLIIIGFGIYAGTRVKTEKDFDGSSRKTGSIVVAGTIMGTLVGGNATVGTAQLAFLYGMDAWWFCLGSGIACLVLGIVMLKPLYASNITTIPQFLVKTYGPAIGPVTSIFTSFGIFFNVVANGLAAVALLTTVIHVGPTVAVLITIVVVLAYVLTGGIQGTGIVGTIKLLLLYVAMIAVAGISLYEFGGFSGMSRAFPEHFPWFSLFGRGVSKDLAAGFSLLVGVLCTQTYIQAIVSTKNHGQAMKGVLASAILIPPVGIGGVLVGLYMRAHVASFPGLQSATANVLPVFILNYVPSFLGGIILATLFISSIGTIAGLNLGISTLLTRDIYKPYIAKEDDDKKALWVQRLLILGLLVLTIICVRSSLGSVLLSFAFLSMGLRGCTALFPLLGAIFFKRFVTPAAGIAAAILGPLADFIWRSLYPKGMDPLYLGLMVSAIVLIVVSLLTRKKVDVVETVLE
ncbi:MAG: sodium:solute symporter family protein [Desulfobaccales bacterium]